MMQFLWVLTLILHSARAQFPVAFTVGHDRHIVQDSSPNQIDIEFDLTLYNHGADLHKGVFTCHEAGLYKFQVYALTKKDAKLFLEVMHNGNLVASLWGHTPEDYAAAGNAFVIELQANDVVKVVARPSYDIALYGADGQIYTTFSGVQLDSQNTNKRVGFTAYLDHSEDFPPATTLVLSSELTNVNNVYDGNDKSNFNAPADGLYIFHLFGLAEKSGELWLEIHHQLNYIVSIYGYTDQEWSEAGNTVILRLARHDAVYIRTRGDHWSNLYGRPDQKYVTWSGAQLPDNTDAFSVGLSHDHSFDAKHIIVFNRVFVNMNNIYDAGSGIFTVHRAGLYELNAHALGQKNAKVWLEIHRNGGFAVSLYSHKPNKYGGAGNSVVLQLFAGDRITVRAHNATALYGRGDQVYCTFSGYLIHPM